MSDYERLPFFFEVGIYHIQFKDLENHLPDDISITDVIEKELLPIYYEQNYFEGYFGPELFDPKLIKWSDISEIDQTKLFFRVKDIWILGSGEHHV